MYGHITEVYERAKSIDSLSFFFAVPIQSFTTGVTGRTGRWQTKLFTVDISMKH